MSRFQDVFKAVCGEHDVTVRWQSTHKLANGDLRFGSLWLEDKVRFADVDCQTKIVTFLAEASPQAKATGILISRRLGFTTNHYPAKRAGRTLRIVSDRGPKKNDEGGIKRT